jgi:hypothetical protein
MRAGTGTSVRGSHRLRSWLRLVLDLVAIGAALVMIGSYFPHELMFAQTITNGGDMASHFYPVVYLRDTLLPKGELTGWCPGNYCGFPLFQFYFPLPFLGIALLGKLIPVTVAFKLGTVSGLFLLPICSYLGLRLAGIPFPGPALGALAPLCFLFMEANSMWGGNIPSTLAGEFTFSIGLALAVLFLGALRWTIAHDRGRIWCGVLEAVVGMCHGYTLLWAGLGSLAELIAIRGWWRRFGTLVAVHGLAILLMGFWLLPLLGYARWTTSYNHVWIINSWREIVPPILWPAAATAVVSALIVLAVCLVRRRPVPRGLAQVWFMTVIGGSVYFVAHALHVVDIRFLPFLQLGICLAAAAGLGTVLAMLPSPEVWPIAGALTIPLFVQSHVTFIPSWIKWNYSGFEAKAPWPSFRDLNARLKGDFRDPRVVYEHSPEHEAVGTVRAFENLPLFSGRSTLEGLYMQGSPTAPFVFYLQSEVSAAQSCPFPDWGCARLDLARGVGHLRMMNVSQFIVRSAAVKAAAAREPGLEREFVVGPYEVYRVRDNDPRYAIPLARAPVLVLTDDWKTTSYEWFKRAGPDDTVPVFATPDAVAPAERDRFAAVTDGLPATMPVQPLQTAPALRETMDPERIVVEGTTPGNPILIRVSYHPRWKATTGERIWLAGPSFMLVFPTSDRLELVYDGGPPVMLGRLFTALGWSVVLLSLLPMGRRLGARVAAAARRLGELGPFRPLTGLVRRSAGWTVGTRYAVLATGLAVVLGTYVAAAMTLQGSDADSLYRRGQQLYGAGHLDEALPLFLEAQRLSPLSATAIHSAYFSSITMFRKEDWAGCAAGFQALLDRFPEAPSAAESTYHLGLCRAHLGEKAAAVEAWHAVQERFPDTPWAKYAGDRLAELKP